MVAGIGASSDGLFVFDAGWPRVVSLDPYTLRVKDTFGREGRGPGEFAVLPNAPNAPPGAMAVSDRIYVRDLRNPRIQSFDFGGSVNVLYPRADRLQMSVADIKLAARGDTVFIASGYFDMASRPPGGDRTFMLKATYGDSVWTVIEMPMQRIPLARGVEMFGLAEARPLWAIHGSCAYVNSGADTTVIRLNRSTGATDTLFLLTPDATDLGARNPIEFYRRVGFPDFPSPNRLRRIEDLSVDPSGGIWALLIPSDPRPTALVSYLGPDGQRQLLNLPVFPKAFGANGAMFGIDKDSMGVQSVVRLN